MVVKYKRLYIFVLIACMTGYIWLLFHLFADYQKRGYNVCLFKYVTGIPCPSCGSTASVIAILHGKFLMALSLNPLGFVIFSIMVVSPIWIIFDLITKKDSFAKVYQWMESFFRRPIIYIPIILIILIIWIFNISGR